ALVLSAPGVIETYEQLARVREKMGPRFEKMFEEAGFVLLAWADASVPWVLAYGDAEIAAIEASSGSMGLRAERAEDAALEFIVVAVASWIALFIVSLLVARSIFNGQIEDDDSPTAASVPVEEATLVTA
ncbi:MAG: hypothetical protein ACERLM_08795, partial [Acidimicrobiales bacterium]